MEFGLHDKRDVTQLAKVWAYVVDVWRVAFALFILAGGNAKNTKTAPRFDRFHMSPATDNPLGMQRDNAVKDSLERMREVHCGDKMTECQSRFHETPLKPGAVFLIVKPFLETTWVYLLEMGLVRLNLTPEWTNCSKKKNVFKTS